MGLLWKILSAPIMLPTKGLLFIFDKIREQAETELWDEGKVHQQLLQLQMMLDLGEISEADFYAAEDELLDRMDAIIAHKQGLDDEESDQESGDRGQGSLIPDS
ncbi:MAG: gas vesicle protein [Chloroflexi bacterium HGW-Chloroflexi-1]|nr:MAG: gas vesicle protein [Chloroflexi bacterium HGW-Chloroflexi-1]